MASNTPSMAREEVESVEECTYSGTPKDQKVVFTGSPSHTSKKAADYKKRGYEVENIKKGPSGIFGDKSEKHTYTMVFKGMKEETDTISEQEIDIGFHRIMARKVSQQINSLKKRNRPVPDELLFSLDKHKQQIEKAEKEMKPVQNEDVDFATARSDRGAMRTYVKYGKGGKAELVTRRDPRKEIKIGEPQKTNEAIKDENMMQDSVDKLKTDPLVSKEKIKLPPSQGVKAIGGEEQVHTGKYSVAEETLNKLYESLSEKNKEIFLEKIKTEDGVEELLKFAKLQGF
jgi:hypothetical protein